MSEPVNVDLILTELRDDLAEMDFVEWDRYAGGEWREGVGYVSVYGWIDREGDDYKDFVQVTRWENGGVYFTTSSAEYTKDVYEVLFDDTIDDHNDCRRVEDVLDLPNMVEL